MQPIVNGLEKEFGSDIEFVKINIDDPNSAAAKQEYGFRYQPFFVLVSADGEVLEEWPGYTDAALFEDAFATVLEN
jgi:thiol-disulfide isomerase/thioredoxin